MPPPRLLTIGLLASSIGLGLAGASVQGARHRPDFSGEWVLDLANSRLHEDYSVLKRAVVHIDHREPTFTFRRIFTVKGRPSETSYTVTTDGKEHRAIGPNGGDTTAAMRWDRDALVVQQRISDPKAGSLTNDVRYELVDSAASLRATEDFAAGGRSHHNVWGFRRRQQLDTQPLTRPPASFGLVRRKRASRRASQAHRERDRIPLSRQPRRSRASASGTSLPRIDTLGQMTVARSPRAVKPCPRPGSRVIGPPRWRRSKHQPNGGSGATNQLGRRLGGRPGSDYRESVILRPC